MAQSFGAFKANPMPNGCAVKEIREEPMILLLREEPIDQNTCMKFSLFLVIAQKLDSLPRGHTFSVPENWAEFSTRNSACQDFQAI